MRQALFITYVLSTLRFPLSPLHRCLLSKYLVGFILYKELVIATALQHIIHNAFVQFTTHSQSHTRTISLPHERLVIQRLICLERFVVEKCIYRMNCATLLQMSEQLGVLIFLWLQILKYIVFYCNLMWYNRMCSHLCAAQVWGFSNSFINIPFSLFKPAKKTTFLSVCWENLLYQFNSYCSKNAKTT